MAPSVMRSRRSPAGMIAFTQSPSAAMWASIQFIGYSASVKMLRKSAAMMVPSTAQPQKG